MNIEELKDSYKNQRAFIIGNGPSLKLRTLKRLAQTNWATFGMNRIGHWFTKTDWRPQFYIGFTTAFWDIRHRADILKGIRSAEIAICRESYRDDLKGMDDNVIYVHCSDTEDMSYDVATNEFWSDDISERVSIFGVMAFPTMQIAAYLGFNPLFLIGCDGGYRPPVDGIDLSHFDPNYRPFDAYPNYDYDELNRALLRAHDISQVAADRLGIEIINLSSISVIEAHKFMNLDRILNAGARRANE